MELEKITNAEETMPQSEGAILREKRCCTCKKVKPIELFSRNRSNPDGRSVRCKECDYASWVKSKKNRIAANNGGGNEGLRSFTNRELLKELKDRGYKWDGMRIEMNVEWEKI